MIGWRELASIIVASWAFVALLAAFVALLAGGGASLVYLIVNYL